MSRIAGLIGAGAAARIDAVTAALSHAAPIQPHAARQCDPSQHVRFVATAFHGCPQAMQNDRLAVVIDGAICNAAELGAQDLPVAELVADLYGRYGFAEMLPRLNGDFSIALYDREQDMLWLARDRLGVKPLYYASGAGLFGFASRPRPLLGLPGVGAAMNRRFAAVFAASHYRYFDNRPEESPYERVSQLPAAHWLCLRGGRVQTGSYWRVEDHPEWRESEDTLAERYRELLLDAVDLRVRSARRPAFTLSGGMDSSSVLACAVNRLGARQEALSTVYDDKTYDESDEIRTMLETTVSRWHPVKVNDLDVFGTVGRMVEVNDEPVATATWLSHFRLCERAASAGFGALFGGLGGDELNAGEYEYFFFHFADLRQAGRDAELEREIERWVAHHDHPIHRKNTEAANRMIAQCADMEHPGRCRPDQMRLQCYYSALDPDFYNIGGFAPVMEAPFRSYLKTRTYQDLTRETAPCCLRAEDRQTAAFGLENYVPFFDHRLIEFMYRVPGSMKIRDGVTKILLRKAMKGLLPEETRTRIKKTGWNAPAHLWFSGEGRTQLNDLLHSRRFRESGIYRISEVMRLADEHEQIVSSGALRENHMMFFWQLVNLDAWLGSLAAA